MPETSRTKLDAGINDPTDAGTELVGTMAFFPRCNTLEDPQITEKIAQIVKPLGFKIRQIVGGEQDSDCTVVYPSPTPGCPEISLQVRMQGGIMVQLEKDGVIVLGDARTLVRSFVDSSCPPIQAEAHVVGISLKPGSGSSQTIIETHDEDGNILPETATFYMYEGGTNIETTAHTADFSLNEGDQMTIETKPPNRVLQDGRGATQGMACSVGKGGAHTDVSVDPTLAATALLIGVVNLRRRRKEPKPTSKKK